MGQAVMGREGAGDGALAARRRSVDCDDHRADAWMASVMRAAFDSGTSLWQGARRSGADAST
jgi:hypothetical protein